MTVACIMADSPGPCVKASTHSSIHPAFYLSSHLLSHPPIAPSIFPLFIFLSSTSSIFCFASLPSSLLPFSHRLCHSCGLFLIVAQKPSLSNFTFVIHHLLFHERSLQGSVGPGPAGVFWPFGPGPWFTLGWGPQGSDAWWLEGKYYKY